jgi:hypothetical protein
VVLHIVYFKVDQHKTAEYTVVEYQIDPVVRVVDGDAVLPPDKGKALAQFEQELLEM